MSSPLSGLKVLDFSTLLPGPFASMMLADMGADVVKVESPTRPDMLHGLAPGFKSDQRKTSYANLTINRNKRSLALNLKQPESLSAIKKLIAEYDIVIEQFRPEVMTKLGLGYEVLSQLNPKLIYCSITGYGQTGPLKHKAGHDINYLALSGLASYSGTKESGPVLSGTQIADIAGGSHHAVMAILAAVIQRSTTGKGQHLDISMTDAAFALNAMFGAGAVGKGISPSLGDTLLNGGCFYDYYQTLDNRYVSVGGLEPQFAKGFFALIGHADWFERSLTPDPNTQAQLKRDIKHAFAQHSYQYWLEVFADSDVCVEPVLTIEEAADSELIKARNMVTESVVDGVNVMQIASPIKFGHEQEKPTSAPKCGEHNDSLLSGLGFSAEQIKSMTHG
ncbi:MAG: CoA transferase [Gammaproteobacteria bacterium]|nr:CoA transferase [Gammaproteobacteria bacterium]